VYKESEFSDVRDVRDTSWVQGFGEDWRGIAGADVFGDTWREAVLHEGILFCRYWGGGI